MMETIGMKDREEYSQNKNAVISYLDECIQSLQKWEKPEKAEPLQRLQDNVREGLFSIVLVGEFSAGKSTFLNALMGKRILPSFTSETTATVNFLRHTSQSPGEGIYGRVHYQDGTTEDIYDLSLSALEKVVSTKGDKGDKKIATTVDHVDLFLDSDFLQEGVMLVDSPGLNGTADHHREITEQQIRSSHASIFVFNADQPGSKTNFEYLNFLRSQSKNIFFVLNKIDVIKADEVQTPEDVIQILEDEYHKQFPEAELPTIWPVAARAALVARDPNVKEYQGGEIVSTEERRNELEQFSRLEKFEERLWKYLTKGERTHDQMVGPVGSALTAINEEYTRFKEQVQVLESQQSSADLEQQKEILEQALAEMKGKRPAVTSSLSKGTSEALRNVQEKAQSQCAAVYTQITNQLESLESPEEIQEYADKINRDIWSQFSRIAETTKNELRNELLTVVCDEYEQFMDELEDHLSQSHDQSQFHLDKKEITIQDLSTGVDLEEYEKKIKELNDQIEKAEQAESESHSSMIAAQRQQLELDEKKAELRQLQQSRDLISQMVIPDVTYHTKIEYEAHIHGGVLGLIKTALLGRRQDAKQIEVKDDSARNQALKLQESRLKEIEKRKNELEREIKSSAKPGVNSEDAEYRRMRAQNELQRLNAERQKKMHEIHETMKKASERRNRRLRREILDFVSGIESDVSNAISSYLNEQRQQFVQCVKEIANSSVDQEIAKKQKELEDKINLLQTEGAEREQKLEELKASIEESKLLLQKGIDLSSDLESMMQDFIE